MFLDILKPKLCPNGDASSKNIIERVLEGAAQRGAQLYFNFALLQTLFHAANRCEGNPLKHRLKIQSCAAKKRMSSTETDSWEFVQRVHCHRYNFSHKFEFTPAGLKEG